jgi:hypothetical protein
MSLCLAGCGRTESYRHKLTLAVWHQARFERS